MLYLRRSKNTKAQGMGKKTPSIECVSVQQRQSGNRNVSERSTLGLQGIRGQPTAQAHTHASNRGLLPEVLRVRGRGVCRAAGRCLKADEGQSLGVCGARDATHHRTEEVASRVFHRTGTRTWNLRMHRLSWSAVGLLNPRDHEVSPCLTRSGDVAQSGKKTWKGR